MANNVHVLDADLPVLSKLDRFRKAADEACKLWSQAHEAEGGGIKECRAWLKRCAAMEPMLPALRSELAAINRPATRSEIASALITLRDNLPPGNRPVSAASNRMMAERVGATEPSIGAVNFAVLKMIDELEWYPVTAKALDALAGTASRLELVAHALNRIPLQKVQVSQKLAEAERDEAAYLARRAAQIAYQRGQAEPPA